MTLWLRFGYILGFVAASSAASTVQLPPELVDRAVAFAKTMEPSDEQLLRNLHQRDADALHAVAAGIHARADGDENATSVLLWHALADGPSAHVPSALALGSHYRDGGDRRGALRYFVMASNDDDGPSQTAMREAGRLFSEINLVASSLEYFKKCANFREDRPNRSANRSAETAEAEACTEAHGKMSARLIKGIKGIKGGVALPRDMDGIADVFPQASLGTFPSPGTEEHGMWIRGLEHLRAYSTSVREGIELGIVANFKEGQKTLMKVRHELEQLKDIGEQEMLMSKLQNHLLGVMLARLRALTRGHEEFEGRSTRDEL